MFKSSHTILFLVDYMLRKSVKFFLSVLTLDHIKSACFFFVWPWKNVPYVLYGNAEKGPQNISVVNKSANVQRMYFDNLNLVTVKNPKEKDFGEISSFGKNFPPSTNVICLKL